MEAAKTLRVNYKTLVDALERLLMLKGVDGPGGGQRIREGLAKQMMERVN